MFGSWGQLIDLYLSDAYYQHWPEIQRLAYGNDKESFQKLKKYALEGYVERRCRGLSDGGLG